ncbi:Transcription initiation protein spt5, partial [Rasamsonia emersonii CBS 393.64]
GFDAFAAGSRTPAWGAPNPGGRTPAWNAQSSTASNNKSYDAPTPGGDYSAPTPGAYASAPTPGALAPTPRGYADSAPTPGALNAPTPGGYSRPYDAPTPAVGSGVAATPGASADDGGPRYEEGTPSP